MLRDRKEFGDQSCFTCSLNLKFRVCTMYLLLVGRDPMVSMHAFNSDDLSCNLADIEIYFT